MAPSFVPRTSFGLAFRAAASRLLGIAWFADLFIGRRLRDQIELPDYARPRSRSSHWSA